ncbi:MAG TPA: ROK family transcriptional regulator [Aestuariivirgaceae bacterium]|nr:ROK family transcriptional regulator [Aestuariivirgaceae bacterium]
MTDAALAETLADARPDDLARGTSRSGGRIYNERLALSLIRRHGSMPKAEIARRTGLSAQTVSIIVRQLVRDGLLLKEKPRRGSIGQPPVPVSLNPDGAFFVGIKIGRRSADIMLVDLVGRVRAKVHEIFPYPMPAHILALVRSGFDRVTASLRPEQRKRLAGIGVATPYELWNWASEMGAPHEALAEWRVFDLKRELSSAFGLPVHVCNDASAACAAELTFGRGDRFRDFAYFFIGTFIGGGVVLNGSLFQGRTGNAGALGSMPVSAGEPGGGQLINSASLYTLEHKLVSLGRDPSVLWQNTEDWGDIGAPLEAWIAEAAAALATAILSAVAVIDFEAVIIDGAMPANVLGRLIDRVRADLSRMDQQGLSSFVVEAGAIGAAARALGGASLPLIANFATDRDILFKDHAA